MGEMYVGPEHSDQHQKPLLSSIGKFMGKIFLATSILFAAEGCDVRKNPQFSSQGRQLLKEAETLRAEFDQIERIKQRVFSGELKFSDVRAQLLRSLHLYNEKVAKFNVKVKREELNDESLGKNRIELFRTIHLPEEK